jgi:hypothetical protein
MPVPIHFVKRLKVAMSDRGQLVRVNQAVQHRLLLSLLDESCPARTSLCILPWPSRPIQNRTRASAVAAGHHP